MAAEKASKAYAAMIAEAEAAVAAVKDPATPSCSI